ncbi:MAG TPA: hypothetical protein PKE03_11900 [Bacteroidales bacterium]|nr:hypothetical protein [Bacteroidales bacterium]
MKKALVIFAAAMFLVLAAGACKSSSKCAAYGEVHKFQKEVKY